MSGKIMWTGLGLSALGLGWFFPVVAPLGAILLVFGVVLLWLDK